MIITTPMVVGYMIGVIILTLISAIIRFRERKVYRNGIVNDWGELEQFWVPLTILAWPVTIPGMLGILAICLVCVGIGKVFSLIWGLHLKVGEAANKLIPGKEKVESSDLEETDEEVFDPSETSETQATWIQIQLCNGYARVV